MTDADPSGRMHKRPMADLKTRAKSIKKIGSMNESFDVAFYHFLSQTWQSQTGFAGINPYTRRNMLM